MPTQIEWSSIALRLALTAIASAAIGLNRGEHNRPVGLRTTMLVALAAAISMIQVNLLLPITGKSADSYVVLDLMRLPLGILSGMGFIGAGAIVRRNNLVQGVTTAATLWFITVMGLCFGGGQLVLGLAAMALALFILWCLKWVEERVEWERRAELRIAFETGAAVEQQICPVLSHPGFPSSLAASFSTPADRCAQCVMTSPGVQRSRRGRRQRWCESSPERRASCGSTGDHSSGNEREPKCGCMRCRSVNNAHFGDAAWRRTLVRERIWPPSWFSSQRLAALSCSYRVDRPLHRVGDANGISNRPTGAIQPSASCRRARQASPRQRNTPSLSSAAPTRWSC
jgi:putative Mg2+ transporter-C (MgtC) family protein